MELKLLDLFSGIAGFSYAAEKIVGGYKTTQFVEKDPYCQSVIRKNFPNIPIHDDITTFKAERGQFDVFTIGFPCQDLSVAGRKKGIGEGTRSGLFYESIRLLREVRPRFALFENVRNLLSHENGETFQEVLFQIAKAGYDAEWSVISARDMGACHLRERIWIVAYTNGKRLERRLPELQQELQETGQPGQKDSLCSTNTDSSGTQGNSEGMEKPIWKHAFFNSKERRTLSSVWTGYVSESCLCRGADRLRGRVARLKALGNSIVPACAAVPLQRIKDLNSSIYND